MVNFFERLSLMKGETLSIITPSGAFAGAIFEVQDDFIVFNAVEKTYDDKPIHSEVLIPRTAICGVKRTKPA